MGKTRSLSGASSPRRELQVVVSRLERGLRFGPCLSGAEATFGLINMVFIQFAPVVSRRACLRRLIGNGEEDQAERVISATELNMLPCLYPWSINVVVYHDPSGRIHLGRSLALRCFQRLSLPNIATQRCRGRDNWNTSGSSDPVLSY